jgi:DNA repair protein RecN (Recombination protein N)
VDKARRVVEDLWDHARDLADELASLGADPEARAREVDVLRRQIGEIRNIAPRPDEDGLGEELERLQNAGRLREEAATARSEVDAARDQVAEAVHRLERTADAALLAGAGALRATIADLEAVAEDLRGFLETVVDDPEQLEAVRDRYVAIRDLRRRFGPELSDVIDFAASAEARLADLERADQRAEEIRSALEDAEGDLRVASERLGALRRRAAVKLGRSVTGRLVDLALPEARLEVAVTPAGRIERHGGDEVVFLFAAAPDLEPRPLGKVASGGELSRVMLSLASEIADLAAPPTIVFDEVDAGTGGEAATAVGSALSAQSTRRQLICVTHLAQVAAHADTHIVVKKESATATAARVEGAARIVELSRMLSGSPESDRARQHAKELLTLASASKRNRPRNSIE